MKTTLEIPDDLFADAIEYARRAGRPLDDIVVDGLRRVIVASVTTGKTTGRRIRLPFIECGPPGTLNIPDDAAARLDGTEDAERYAASL